MKNLGNTEMFKITSKVLLTSTAFGFVNFVALPSFAQDCVVDANGKLIEDCAHTNAGQTVSMGAEENQEFEDLPDLSNDGFELSVDGNAVSQSGQILNQKVESATQRQQDLDLFANNISIQFDGGELSPRLDARVTGNASGSSISIANEMNYPAFVTRGELRVLEANSIGRARLLKTYSMDPNTGLTVELPETNGELIFVYRVYDAKGRFDETSVSALSEKGRSTGNDTDVELGTDATERRAIPLNGGAVTVSGHGLPAGTNIKTLGTTTVVSPEGKFVLQRILPKGHHAIDVAVGNKKLLTRELEIKSHDLFLVGIADLTIGRTLQDDLLDASGEDYDETTVRGRVALYLKGKIRGDVLLTASLDTGEEDIDDILSKFDEKTAGGLLDRIDPDEYYPVYGDDSTSVDDAPTSGKLYVKVERENNFVLWGDFSSEIDKTEYLRNTRTLYGAQANVQSATTTSAGEAKYRLQAYAASPDTLPANDRLTGTGGSTYFLRNADITPGSETVILEVVNPVTGVVVNRETLQFGVDYDINYVQGLILLRAPLTSNSANGDLVTNSISGDLSNQLVVTYDYTPGSTAVDGYSYGGRAEGWLTDNLRIGLTSHVEKKGTSDLEVQGIDIRLQATENSFLDLEFAQSEGDGFIESISSDGGMTFNTTAASTGTGEAWRVAGQASLSDFGLANDGALSFYYEDQTAGFASLTTQTNVDLTRWGIEGDIQLGETARLGFGYDDYSDSAGTDITEANAQLTFDMNAQTTVTVGLEHYDISSVAETGERTDAAFRLDYTQNKNQSFYVFGQFALDVSGGLTKNDRYGVGADVKLNDQWSVSGELSDGSDGLGARLLATYDRDSNSSYYFGYTFDPSREIGSGSMGNGDGAYVVGGRSRLSDQWSVFAENTYDLFGQHRSLTSVYGATYDHSENLSFTGGVEYGTVTDATDGTDLKRTALSLGTSYRDDTLSLGGRLEYRKDEGMNAGDNNDGDAIAATLTARYKISDNARVLFDADWVESNNDSALIPDAEYGEVLLGYAFRPVDNDRLNVLAKYRYVYDMTDRTTTAVGTDPNFDQTLRQRSHIASIDASYDINNHFTIGGKLGGRWSRMDSGAGFVSNDAWLGVANLRYHVVHEWDALLEYRMLDTELAGKNSGILAAVYKHVGNNAKVGLGYNFSTFSDDLADTTYDNEGLFLNIIAKY